MAVTSTRIAVSRFSAFAAAPADGLDPPPEKLGFEQPEPWDDTSDDDDLGLGDLSELPEPDEDDDGLPQYGDFWTDQEDADEE